ncbi:uncharacterized protein [Musca autumnalis]|uniref:uncharacterized protein n=1 Tax=Musca autumnalis TaxID=221902 RepID=UPI003CE8A988
MENLSKIAATLPDIEDELLMSDEERDLDIMMAPEKEIDNQDPIDGCALKAKEVEDAPIREIAQNPPLDDCALKAKEAEDAPIWEIARNPPLDGRALKAKGTEVAPIQEVALTPHVPSLSMEITEAAPIREVAPKASGEQTNVTRQESSGCRVEETML